MRPITPPVRFADFAEIFFAWFSSKIVRRFIRADWGPGDHTVGLLSTAPGGNRMIRWYPEEYLASTKGGRATMIASTMMPVMLALSFFYYLGPPIVAGELDAAKFQFTVVFLGMSAWTLLDSQSFLRWMFRNWNTPVDN